MYRVLVIWWIVPESVEYIVLETTPDMEGKLRSFHDHFVNGVNTATWFSQEISDFFHNDDGTYRHNHTRRPITKERFDLVITTGFVL